MRAQPDAGDPAARSFNEVLLAYTEFVSRCAAYRLAHRLHTLGIRCFRMMSE